MKLMIRAVMAATLFGVATTIAFAQSYPAKPIRIIVPYPAGGTSDILVRQEPVGLTFVHATGGDLGAVQGGSPKQ